MRLTSKQTEQKERENEAYEKASFDGAFNRIVCIGLIFFSREMEPRGAASWYGTNEKELLQQFENKLRISRSNALFSPALA